MSGTDVPCGPLIGDTYLTFNYENANTNSDYRYIQVMASLAHWEDMNLFREFIDLGGEG